MKQLDRMKDFFKNLSGRTKKIIAITVSGLLILSAALAMALNNTDYAVLFSGVNEEEAKEVMAKLQDMEVPYQYNQQGSVLVPKDSVDKTRGMLAVDGYPKSGFSYDVFTEHAGMMSTESEKETYKLYQLQERIGSTIRTLDGVKSAVVTISQAKDSKYILNTDNTKRASAYVVVHMYDGGSPSREQAEAIQRLVAKAVPDMELGDVAVLDGNGVDVSAVKDSDSETVDGNKKLEYESREEAKLRNNILNVLEGIYGRGNVNVSVKCTADMQRVLSEELSYSAPDTQNNSGYISRQTLSAEGNGQQAGAAGIPGTQSNTNVTQYNAGQGTTADIYSSNSETTYELNQKKVQGQNDSGAISDVSVAISINQKAVIGGGPGTAQLVALVARAAGIAPELQNEKISIVMADFYNNANTLEVAVSVSPTEVEADRMRYLPFVLGGILLLLLLLIFFSVMGIKKRNKKKLLAELEAEIPLGSPAEEEAPEEEILTIDKGSRIKSQIQGFAEDNPEISAALLRSWVRSEEGN